MKTVDIFTFPNGVSFKVNYKNGIASTLEKNGRTISVDSMKNFEDQYSNMLQSVEKGAVTLEELFTNEVENKSILDKIEGNDEMICSLKKTMQLIDVEVIDIAIYNGEYIFITKELQNNMVIGYNEKGTKITTNESDLMFKVNEYR